MRPRNQAHRRRQLANAGQKSAAGAGRGGRPREGHRGARGHHAELGPLLLPAPRRADDRGVARGDGALRGAALDAGARARRPGRAAAARDPASACRRGRTTRRAGCCTSSTRSSARARRSGCSAQSFFDRQVTLYEQVLESGRGARRLRAGRAGGLARPRHRGDGGRPRPPGGGRPPRPRQRGGRAHPGAPRERGHGRRRSVAGGRIRACRQQAKRRRP